MDTIQIVFAGIIGLSWLKHILGYRFPWEVCECCGAKIRDHHKHEEQTERAEFEKVVSGFSEARKR